MIVFHNHSRVEALAAVDALPNDHQFLFLDPNQSSPDGRAFFLNAMPFHVSCYDSKTINPRQVAAFDQILINADLASLNQTVISIGGHIAEGRASLPVFETLAELGRIIGVALRAEAVGWKPSGNAIGFAHYDDAVSRFVAGGAFPVLGFVGLCEISEAVCQTQGLSYFTGYELRLSSQLSLPTREIMRILVRLISDIVINGDMEPDASIAGPVAGQMIDFDGAQDITDHAGDSRIIQAVIRSD